MLKILVVDDERAQRETLCRGLFFLGHLCVSAASSHEAMRLMGQQDDPFDLLLTDLTMPEESGLRLMERALTRQPDLLVLVITGLHSSRDIESIRALGIPILQKPFSPDQLEAAIQELL